MSAGNAGLHSCSSVGIAPRPRVAWLGTRTVVGALPTTTTVPVARAAILVVAPEQSQRRIILYSARYLGRGTPRTRRRALLGVCTFWLRIMRSHGRFGLKTQEFARLGSCGGAAAYSRRSGRQGVYTPAYSHIPQYCMCKQTTLCPQHSVIDIEWRLRQGSTT